jgi:hypothetical protein
MKSYNTKALNKFGNVRKTERIILFYTRNFKIF